MKRRNLYLVAALCAPAASAQAAAVGSDAASRKAVAVTVYNDGRGLVREERVVALPDGVSELRFMDVSGLRLAVRLEARAQLLGVPFSMLEGHGPVARVFELTGMRRFIG